MGTTGGQACRDTPRIRWRPRSAFLLLLVPTILPAAAPPPDLVFAGGSGWEDVSSGHQFAEGMAWDADGHFYFTEVPRGELFKVDRDTGTKSCLDGASGRANDNAFGPDGRLYGCASGDRYNYARISPDGAWHYTAYAADLLRRRLRPDCHTALASL